MSNPWSFSFTRNRIVFSDDCSTKTAIALSPPATVPTSINGGWELRRLGWLYPFRNDRRGEAAEGGRRDGEKIGRSRVIESFESGTGKTARPAGMLASDGACAGCDVAWLILRSGSIPSLIGLLPRSPARQKSLPWSRR